MSSQGTVIPAQVRIVKRDDDWDIEEQPSTKRYESQPTEEAARQVAYQNGWRIIDKAPPLDDD